MFSFSVRSLLGNRNQMPRLSSSLLQLETSKDIMRNALNPTFVSSLLLPLMKQAIEIKDGLKKIKDGLKKMDIDMDHKLLDDDVEASGFKYIHESRKNTGLRKIKIGLKDTLLSSGLLEAIRYPHGLSSKLVSSHLLQMNTHEAVSFSTMPNKCTKWLAIMKNKVMEQVFKVVTAGGKFQEDSGTLTIIVRGVRICGIFCGSDGYAWFNGKRTETIDCEKVFNLNNSVIAIISGRTTFPHLMVEELREANLNSAVECALFCKEFMTHSPLEKLMSRCTLYEKVVLWYDTKFMNGFKALQNYTIYFASYDGDNSNLAIYYGANGSLDLDNPYPYGLIVGNGEEYAIAGIKRAMSKRGMPSGKYRDSFISRCIMESIAIASEMSDESDAVGGKITIKKVGSDGVVDIWDGLVGDMIEKHNLRF